MDKDKQRVFFLSSPEAMFIDFRERETSMRERHIGQLLPVHALIGNRTYSLCTCPDQESTPQPFGVGDDIPTH